MPVAIGGGKGGQFDTSTQLYNFAYDKGLKEKADLVVAKHSGEEYKKIFSGGTISDIFDVLSIDSYGVVGLLKGKSFMEGVKSRESFADKDSLGQFGLAGAAAGILADIVVSPTTYIAPWTVLKKVPGFMKLGSAIKTAAVGKMVDKTVDAAGKTIKFQEREGGTAVGRYLADKLVWQSGQDPVFKETFEKFQRDLGISVVHAQTILKPLSRLDQKVGENLLMRDETGRFARKSIDQLQSELTSEDFAKVKPVWDEMDRLSKELVELGVLGSSKYEEGVGTYIKNAYMEYEEKKAGRFFASKATGVKGTKKRSDTLTEEGMKELGQIDDPAYLAFRSLMDMNRDVANAKLFKKVNELFGSTTELPGFTKVADTKRFQVNQGAISESATKIKDINTKLDPLFNNLKEAFKDNRSLTSSINKLQKQVAQYQGMGIKELEKLSKLEKSRKATMVDEPLKLGDEIDDPIVLKATSKKRVKVITTQLKQLAKQAKDFRTGFKQGDATARKQIAAVQSSLIKLIKQNFERADRGMFIDKIKNTTTPDKLMKATYEVLDMVKKVDERNFKKDAKAIYDELLSLSKTTKGFIDKIGALKGDKSAAIASMVKLEEEISNLKFAKEDLVEEIAFNKTGQLAGKYIPEKMMEYLDELIEPTADSLGNKIMAEFKFNKVVLSPATHVRNVVSNMVLNWWKLGIPPTRLDLYASSVNDIVKKTPMYRRAQKAGLGASTYASQELKGLLTDPQMAGFGKNLGSKWASVKQTLGDLYQEEENIAKLVAFKHGLEKGLTDEDAWKAAESATFNYAQVTPFIRQVRTSLFGAPFITFAIKAVPAAIETAVKSPQRIAFFQKFRTAMEEQSDTKETAEEKKAMPDWMREGFYVKLPMKDEYGRSAYFDLTYIIPFSTLITQGANLTKTIAGEKLVGSETVGQELTSLTPALNVIAELAKNKDFVGNKIFRETDSFAKQVFDLSEYMLKVFAPPPIAAQLQVGYNKNGEQVGAGILKSMAMAEDPQQKETLNQELLSYIGAKIRPFDEEIQSSMNEYNQKEDLKKLLVENGMLQEYRNVYDANKPKQIKD